MRRVLKRENGEDRDLTPASKDFPLGDFYRDASEDVFGGGLSDFYS